MKKSRFSVEQITYALKQVESRAVSVGDQCRKLGISEGRGRVWEGLSDPRPGQTIGEMALLDGQPRSASAVAAEDLVLLVFTREALEHLVEEKPSLGAKVLWKLARFLSQRLRQTSGALAERLE